MKTQVITESSKILGKLMKSVKAEQLETMTIIGNRFIKGELEDHPTAVLVVNSNNPISPKYATMSSNSGMTDRLESVVQQVTGIAKRENTLGGQSFVYNDKPMYVNDWEWHIELNGVSRRYIYMIDEDVFNRIKEGEEVPMNYLTRLKAGFPSVSEKRKGDSPFMDESICRLDTLNRSNFKVASFFKKNKKSPGKLTFDSVKAGTRVKLPASSSKDFPLFKGFEYVSTEHKTYKMHETATTLKESESTVYVLNNGTKDIRIEVADDFEVLINEKLILPLFKKNKAISISESSQLLRRLATDGISYIDQRFALSMGLNFAAGFQFRFTNVGKGLMLVVPNLKEMIGVDVILFDGSVKGDIAPYIMNNEMDFAILNETRKTEEAPSLNISRQIITAIQNDGVLNGLTTSTMAILSKLYALDAQTLKEFIGFCEDVSVEGEEEVLEMDNLTVAQFAANPELFVKSAENKKKLFSLLDATTKKLVNGRSLYLEDASIKHMAVDPYAVLGFMSKGFLSAVRGEHDTVGIRKDQVIVSGSKNGQFVVEHKKAFLARYPFLHSLEGRLVNDDGGFPFNDFPTTSYYSKAFAQGSFQGVILYSLWDMNPEAQSGADFDGDTTVYTTNPIITENVAKTGFFLDYSLVEQEDGSIVLEEGCPFAGGKTTPVNKVLSKSQIAYIDSNDVTFDNGVFVFPEALAEDRQLLEIFADSMAEMSMVNLVSNDIGRYTNLNASVMALMDTLREQSGNVTEAMKAAMAAGDSQAFMELNEVNASVKEEFTGYKKMSFLLACAIRWEIDKAKHGGAYREHMEFLKAFDGLSASEDDHNKVFEMEDTYGVSLERLLFGTKSR